MLHYRARTPLHRQWLRVPSIAFCRWRWRNVGVKGCASTATSPTSEGTFVRGSSSWRLTTTSTTTSCLRTQLVRRQRTPPPWRTPWPPMPWLSPCMPWPAFAPTTPRWCRSRSRGSASWPYWIRAPRTHTSRGLPCDVWALLLLAVSSCGLPLLTVTVSPARASLATCP